MTTPDELRVLRRRGVPLNDEICWAAEPRPGNSSMTGPGQLTCALFIIIPIVVLILTYLFEIYKVTH